MKTKTKIKALSVILSVATAVALTPIAAYASVPAGIIPVSTSGDGQNLAITQDGVLWAWGSNAPYQPGNGTNGDAAAPSKIMEHVISAAAGPMHSLAVTSDGGLWGWGSNKYGQLGISRDGRIAESVPFYSDTPVKIMDGAASAEVNGAYSYVIKKDGTLWAFGGDENSGEYLIGDGTAAQPEPVKVLDNVSLVSAGGSNVLALKTDGSLFIWGDNASGEIGDGTATIRPKPVKVMDGVAAAAMGTFHTLAVKKDGTLWAWGSNYGGALGDGTDKDSTVPVKIMDDVASVAAGTCHSLAVKKDGSLWSWGQGVTGYAGNKGYNLTPEKILEDAVYVCAKQNTNFAVKTDESLWAWGDSVNLGNIYSTPFPREALNGVQMPGAVALPSSAKASVNGKAISLEAYNISDYNYFKLRDIASVLNGTEKQFEVSWNSETNTITLTANKPYTSVGGELKLSGKNDAQKATVTVPDIYLDGVEIRISAYNIGGSNYIKLRDLAEVLNFSVTWEDTSTVWIDTSKTY